MSKKTSKIPRKPLVFDARVRSTYHEILSVLEKHYSLFFLKSDDELCEVSLTTLFSIPVLFDEDKRQLLFRVYSNLFDVCKLGYLFDEKYMSTPELDYSCIKLFDLPFILVYKDEEKGKIFHQKFVDYVSKLSENKEQI